ncbi:MAG: hypothetical protein GXP22_11520 [Gammaproteobacteria bacterium]|nr:hypothetical protein [Gammaproteobacteria bacterium]
MTKKIDDYVERLCAAGCNSVREYIVLLEQGINHKDFSGLNEEEKKYLYRELISIMDVYE